jgi:hypothetical protein
MSVSKDFGVLQHQDDGCKGVVNAAKEAASVVIVAEDSVGLCVFASCIFD